MEVAVREAVPIVIQDGFVGGLVSGVAEVRSREGECRKGEGVGEVRHRVGVKGCRERDRLGREGGGLWLVSPEAVVEPEGVRYGEERPPFVTEGRAEGADLARVARELGSAPSGPPFEQLDRLGIPASVGFPDEGVEGDPGRGGRTPVFGSFLFRDRLRGCRGSGGTEGERG